MNGFDKMINKTPTNLKTQKKIWIDLENSPHVPFFKPIIKELESTGNKVFNTARDCFQVCELADLNKMPYHRIGRHYGKNKAKKVFGLIWRTLQLLPVIKKERPDLAVSHFSRAQMLLSSMLKIPFVVIIDYEHTQWLPFVNPTRVIIPELIPDGVIKGRTLKYPGIKEYVYAADFRPNREVLNSLGLKVEDLIVTVRPPADEAHYHNPEGELLYKDVIAHILSSSDATIVLLPRNKEKQTAFAKMNWPAAVRDRKIIIPQKAVNGMDMIWFSDLVISGGGTMNREAAALNVPVYSIFKGKIGAVDRCLVEENKLTFISNLTDIERLLKFERRNKEGNQVPKNKKTLEAIVKGIVKVE